MARAKRKRNRFKNVQRKVAEVDFGQRIKNEKEHFEEIESRNKREEKLKNLEWHAAIPKSDSEVQLNLVQKAGLGILAGVCAALIGTPAEIALVRMTLDGDKHEAHRFNYKNGFHALFDISQKEGFFKLWRGVMPTMARSMVVNSAQLASYSEAKEILLRSGYFKDDIVCQFVGSNISGLVTVTLSLPVDNVKTRIQNMKTNTDGKKEYNGAVDVFKKIVRNEGFLALWRGFTPYYAKLGTHTVLTFVFLEQLNQAYRKYANYNTADLSTI